MSVYLQLCRVLSLLVLGSLLAGNVTALPEAPTIMRSVTNIEDGELTNPHIPSYRVSNDGRIGLHMQSSKYDLTNNPSASLGDPANSSLIATTSNIKTATLVEGVPVTLKLTFDYPFTVPEAAQWKNPFGKDTQVTIAGVTASGGGTVSYANGTFNVLSVIRGNSTRDPGVTLDIGSGHAVVSLDDNVGTVTGVDGEVVKAFVTLLKPENYIGGENFHDSNDPQKLIRVNPNDQSEGITTVSKIWVDGVEKDFDAPELLRNIQTAYNPGMMTLCEKPSQANPYACSTANGVVSLGGDEDCYDLHILTTDTTTVDDVLRPKLHPDTNALQFDSDGEIILTSVGPARQVWSTQITVSVESPKTSDATIKQVIHGNTWTKGEPFAADQALEPMATADGRLFVFRIGNADYWLGDVDGDGRYFEWEYDAAGEKVDVDSDGKFDREFARYDIMYSYNNSDGVENGGSAYEPCDARGWSNIYPIAFAHNDYRMKNISDDSYKYGFAEYPFVSPEGEDISDNLGTQVTGDSINDPLFEVSHHACLADNQTHCTAPPDIKGTYPWIDKEGANLFMQVVSETLHYKEWNTAIKIVACDDSDSDGDGEVDGDNCTVPDYPLVENDDDNGNGIKYECKGVRYDASGNLSYQSEFTVLGCKDGQNKNWNGSAATLNPCSTWGCVANVLPRYDALPVTGQEEGLGYLCSQNAEGKDFTKAEKWVLRNGETTAEKVWMCSSVIGATKYWVEEGQFWSGDEKTGQTRGVAVAGKWTRGKIVLFDNLLNNTDYGLGVAASQHRMLDLYAGANNDVRTGSARDVANNNISGDANLSRALPIDYPNHTTPEPHHPLGVLKNINFIDSIQNSFNYVDNLKPVTPRDVVWNMSLTGVTAELAFDDYLNPNAYIVSNMMASLRFGDTPENPEGPWERWQRSPQALQKRFDYQDGWEGRYNSETNYKQLWSYMPDRHISERHIPAAIRLQNAASAENFDVPANGKVVDEDVVNEPYPRVEPVANGGIKGRGFWLDSTFKIEYAAVDTANGKIRPNAVNRYISLFLDNRTEPAAENLTRRLLTFSDDSEVHFRVTTGGDIFLLFLNSNGDLDQYLDISSLLGGVITERWLHLGLQVNTVGSVDSVDVYIDGAKFKQWSTSGGYSFAKLDGDSPLVIGGTVGSQGGFVGWIDNFNVFAEVINPEVACNHANGTLFGVDAVSGVVTDHKPVGFTDWAAVATAYDSGGGHTVITNLLAADGKKTYDQYACWHDYTGDYQAHLANVPMNADGQTASIRDVLLMPEGPLLFDAPRPDSENNAFCLSCHTGSISGDPLSVNALTLDTNYHAKMDPRRQPMQSSSRVYGVEPIDAWLGANFSGSDKSYIDEWVLASGATDNDGDGLSNAFERDESNTDMNYVDTDNNGTNDNAENPDADGLTHAEESALGTDPLDADTDDDMVSDGNDNCALVSNANQVDSVVAGAEPDGYGNACDGDLDNDGDVDTKDLQILISQGFGAWVDTAVGNMPKTLVPHINKAASEIDQQQWYIWAKDSDYTPGPSGLN